MPLTIKYLPKQEDKVITMGKEKAKADYYPPGATEPQVRPAHIPPPPLADVEEAAATEKPAAPPVVETVKKASKSTSSKVSKKK